MPITTFPGRKSAPQAKPRASKTSAKANPYGVQKNVKGDKKTGSKKFKLGSLPPELRNMIYDAVVEHAPAIYYASISTASPDDTLIRRGPNPFVPPITVRHATNPRHNPWKWLSKVELAIPEIDTTVKHRLSECKNYLEDRKKPVHPSDLVVFKFGALSQDFSWRRRTSMYKVGGDYHDIRNLGISWQMRHCGGIRCYCQYGLLCYCHNFHGTRKHMTYAVKACPCEVYGLVRAVNGVQNVYLQVMLDCQTGRHCPSRDAVKNTVNEMIAKAKACPDLALFTDGGRTWAEITPDDGATILSRETREVFHFANRCEDLVRFERPHQVGVRFRVLVASYWMK